MVKNDKKIIALQEKIKEQKKTLLFKFNPVTNCILQFQGSTLNIHTLSIEQSHLLLLELNALRMSEKDMMGSLLALGLRDCYSFDGYSIEDWMSDIKGRLKQLTTKAREKALKAMEQKLIKMLSDDKRTELELNEIEKML